MLGVPKFPKGSSVPYILLLAALALSSCSQAAVKSSDVTVKTVPSVVYTSPQGTYLEPTAIPGAGEHRWQRRYSFNQNLTWLFHMVFESHEDRPLQIQEAELSFQRNGQTLWQETYSREYLERIEWIEGAFEYTTQYWASMQEYVDHKIILLEKPVAPDLPPGGQRIASVVE